MGYLNFTSVSVLSVVAYVSSKTQETRSLFLCTERIAHFFHILTYEDAIPFVLPFT